MSLLIAILLFSSIILFYILFLAQSRRKITIKENLPGYRGLPFIGETLLLLKTHPANTLGEFLENGISKYGKIFLSNIMGRKTIVSTDVELNQFVLSRDSKQFKSSWLPAFPRIFGEESITYAEGNIHKRLKSVYLEFLSLERLQTVFLEDADILASGIVKSWKDGSIILAKEVAMKYVMKIMVKNSLSMMGDDHNIQMISSELSHFVPALSSLPINILGTKYWRALKARRNFLKLVNKIIKRRINLLEKYSKNEKIQENFQKLEGKKEGHDFIDLILMKNTHSVETIENLVLGAIFGGHEAAPKAITSMLYFLATSPNAIKRLQEEHLEILKCKCKLEHKLSWNDYKRMEFTKCVIEETLRLINIAPFVIKEVTEDVMYKGIIIPQGYHIMVEMRATHLDSSNFENPFEFNPWRWLESSCLKSKMSYMPFGGGVRMCPGRNLVYLIMAVFLHHIILNFEWEITQHDHPMNIPHLEYINGLPLRVHSVKNFPSIP